jgi:hypothetical protein
MKLIDAAPYPLTDTGHANGAIDLVFNQCTRCHGYPPQGVGHELHVLSKGRQCFECHSSTIAVDSALEYVGSLSYTNYFQRLRKAPGGRSVPIADGAGHINRKTDISFFKGVLYSGDQGYDTLFVWDPAGRSCSNIDCHGGPGDQKYQFSVWQP